MSIALLTDASMSPDPRTHPAGSLGDAVRDAEWLTHRYDPGHDAFHLIPVDRATHRRATFLTDEYLPAGLTPLVVARGDAVTAAAPRAPLHFIFHSGYCCSTLLARALDRPGLAMGLKEPLILNDIVGWRRRGGQGPDMAAVLDATLAQLARPFAPGEIVVAKPSTVVNILAPAIMALRPDATAVLLYAPLPTYLASIAKKGLDGRLWVRTLLLGMIDDGLAPTVFDSRDYLGQTDLQVAAIGWLGQLALFHDLLDRYGAARVKLMDSASLMASPAVAIGDIATMFGLRLDDRGVAAIVEGPAFRRHSKFDIDFDATDRAAEHADAASVHADEIEKVLVWAEHVATAMGLSLASSEPAPAP